MSDIALHRQVVLAALVALAGVAGAVAGAPAGTPETADDVSAQQIDSAVAQADATNETQNVTASFVHDGDRAVLHPHEGQTVRLRTDAAVGTTLTVEVFVNESFAMESFAKVSENGSATFPIDARSLGVSTGTEVSLVARHDDRKIAETTGVVKEVSTEFVYEGDRLVLRATEDETVRVRTDAEPGRELTVKVQGEQFVRTSLANVSEDGTATATFDLSDVESGTEVTVSVFRGDAETEGLILNESASLPSETTEKTETTTEMTETTTGTTDSDSESAVPGFGVPVALLALVASTALARRT